MRAFDDRESDGARSVEDSVAGAQHQVSLLGLAGERSGLEFDAARVEDPGDGIAHRLAEHDERRGLRCHDYALRRLATRSRALRSAMSADS